MSAINAGSCSYAAPVYTYGIIKVNYGQDARKVGDEGGFTPNVQDNMEELVTLASEDPLDQDDRSSWAAL
ncbi:hypothetical protein KY284_033211 [Solanum tuberosum]|nr:hypothetical protein KY284_033211 [Solanum tuberosum]